MRKRSRGTKESNASMVIHDTFVIKCARRSNTTCSPGSWLAKVTLCGIEQYAWKKDRSWCLGGSKVDRFPFLSSVVVESGILV